LKAKPARISSRLTLLVFKGNSISVVTDYWTEDGQLHYTTSGGGETAVPLERIEAASQDTRIGLVLADAEFDSERNHTYIRQQLGAQSVIPAKRGKKRGESAEFVSLETSLPFPEDVNRAR